MILVATADPGRIQFWFILAHSAHLVILVIQKPNKEFKADNFNYTAMVCKCCSSCCFFGACLAAKEKARRRIA